MTETSLREQRSAPKLDAKVAEDIARETGTRVDVVQRIYEEELATLVDRARITQFLGLLADRRVRVRLRQDSLQRNP
jgi:K+-transporting ATPase c subunit